MAPIAQLSQLNVIKRGSIGRMLKFGGFYTISCRTSKGVRKILVEVKSFRGQSKTYEFHQALGQFNNYILALEEQEPERILYLAVPDFIFENFFQKALIRKSVSRYQVKIVVFDPLTKEIVSWKE